MKYNIGYVSTYPPDRCGIATFTKDLSTAIEQNPNFQSQIIAIKNETSRGRYSDEKVKCIIEDTKISSYVEAAVYVNESDIDVVNLQHEFDMYSGEFGENILEFISNLKKPLITTFHTVVKNPMEKRKQIVKQISKRSIQVVVMIESAKNLFKEFYDVDNIKVIPHGIHPINYISSSEYKKKIGERRFVISSSGLLSKRKNLEYVIQALPTIVKKYPNVLYYIIGQTHPLANKHEGEKYREYLMELAHKLSVKNHVRFYNKYLTLDELIQCFQSSDVHITPYVFEEQLSSGTLAYAFGCGRVCISTPYYYARDLLADNRGMLVNFKDHASIAKAVIKIIEKPSLKEEIEKKAYEYSRFMTWPNVAERYSKVFLESMPAFVS